MNDLWVCTTDDKKIAIRCDHAMLTAFEAKRFASQRLGVDPFAVSTSLLHEQDGAIVVDVDPSRLPLGIVAITPAEPDQAPADQEVPDWRGLEAKRPTKPGTLTLTVMPIYEVRWTGSDYSRGGTTGGRRMQEREAGAEEWTNV